ncbi:MAG TPA: thermonuclease family protein [candidate division Zixibacteria bacterium]|nr:thermonuclease family protein [candidate division Zixibacteria bacterium]
MKIRSTAGRTTIAAVLLVCLTLAGISLAARNYGDVDHVHVDEIVDGDTFKVTVPDWPSIIGDSIKVRVAGINCAELRAKLPDSLHLAQQATEFTRSFLGQAHEVSLRNIGRGGFFRIIADVYVDGVNLGDTLVHVGLASRDPEHSETAGKDFVYASRTGAAYHRKDCPYLRKSTVIMTLTREDVADMGYVPCSHCKP